MCTIFNGVGLILEVLFLKILWRKLIVSVIHINNIGRWWIGFISTIFKLIGLILEGWLLRILLKNCAVSLIHLRVILWILLRILVLHGLNRWLSCTKQSLTLNQSFLIYKKLRKKKIYKKKKNFLLYYNIPFSYPNFCNINYYSSLYLFSYSIILLYSSFFFSRVEISSLLDWMYFYLLSSIVFSLVLVSSAFYSSSLLLSLQTYFVWSLLTYSEASYYWRVSELLIYYSWVFSDNSCVSIS